MSRYRTHTLFNLSFFLPLTLLAIVYFFDPLRFDLIAFGLSFAYATFFMTPDADISDKVKLLSVRGIMTLPFRFYSKLFAHRGISHWVIVGTLTRIAWLALCFVIVYTLIYRQTFSLTPILQFYKAHKLTLTYCLAGFILSDIGHLILDKK